MILSLFDRSGAWPRPYAERGERVVTVDLESPLAGSLYPGREHVRCDVARLALDCAPRGMLLAPPCTHFSTSGARWWAGKDASGQTAAHVALVRAALGVVERMRPEWWALENPTGRLRRLVPELRGPLHSFDPCDYGDDGTKRTHLWGSFNPFLTPSASPGRRIGLVHRMPPSPERATLRSITPGGFARAFAAANP